MKKGVKERIIYEYSERFGYSKKQSEFVFDCYGAVQMAWAISLREPIQDANEYFKKFLDDLEELR